MKTDVVDSLETISLGSAKTLAYPFRGLVRGLDQDHFLMRGAGVLLDSGPYKNVACHTVGPFHATEGGLSRAQTRDSLP